MIYNDKVYGRVMIEEKILIDIIKNYELQRLKGIDQFGTPNFYKAKQIHNRFEHSLGVAILLRKFKASLTERVAGIIHDVSHTAFSHNIDYVIKGASGKNQLHQDSIFSAYIKSSALPKIFNKYKIPLKNLLDERNFPLLETKLPDLCADRIDYCLRDANYLKEIKKNEINYYLQNLTVIDKKWVFKNFRPAQKFSNLFLKMNRKYWAGPPTVKMFKSIGDYLKYAVNKKYINYKDFFTTDKTVINKINKHLFHDEILRKYYERTLNKIKCQITTNGQKNNGIYCKSRIIDPLVAGRGKIRRLSEINKKWRAVVAYELKPKKYYIKFY